jgi:hypothetical protein
MPGFRKTNKTSRMRIILTAFLIASASLIAHSQELYCSVSVSSQQDQGSDRTIYNTLQKSLYELMNNKKWTGLSFKVEERIECSFMITITNRQSDVFDAQIMVQSTRPVFNSSYKTPVFSYLDKQLRFEYLQDQSLDWVEGSHLSNLTSVLAYYAYIVIGLDFETMQKGAGSPYFDKAQTIVNNAQGDAKATGWKAFESDKNRYWLLENLTNSRYMPLRDGLYSYHRLGLDVMYDNQESGRQAVVDAILLFQRVYNERPNLFILSLLLNAKADEIVKMFSNASAMQKSRVVQVLTNIDPANAAKYNKIMQSQSQSGSK